MKKAIKVITVNPSFLADRVATASNFTIKDGAFASQVVLSGEEGKMTVKASNYMQTIIYKGLDFISSDLTDQNFKEIAVNAKTLSTVLKAQSGQEIQIGIFEDHIIVKGKRSKIKVDTFNEVQEISIGSKEHKLSLKRKDIELMEKMLHATDENNIKAEMNGVLMQTNDGILNMVGTDTKRLAVASIPTELEGIDIIVPKEAIKMISKLFDYQEPDVELDTTSLKVSNTEVTYETKLINGKFPQWQRIIPKDHSVKITMDRRDLLNLVKEASLLDDELKIVIKENKIKISDLSGHTTVEDECKSGEDIGFGISAKIMIDFLNSFKETEVTIGFNDQNLPLSFIVDENYEEVAMPIVLPDVAVEEGYENAA